MVRGQLEAVMEGMDERPEDVYADCVHGMAHLYLAGEDGFVILRKSDNRFTGKPELTVWVASLFENSTGGHAMERYLANLTAIAKEAGCARIVFRTRRDGFGRLLPEGWKRSLVTYELMVAP